MSWHRRAGVKVDEALKDVFATVAGPIFFASCNIHPMSKTNVVQGQELQS
jgi:hypothetical protein